MWEKIAERIQKNNPDMKKITGRKIFEERVKRRPLGKEQTPEDIGNVVNFLSSDEARSITGQSINVNNGTIMN
jgi:enoyl-[acyl-carrier-protein] reductase (NADH)